MKDAYTLPRIDVCLDALAGATWFSTFDLRPGYHQVELDSRDADKTTCATRRRNYRFKVMPFGLCNVPPTFQRLMNVALAGLDPEICLVYLDDIVVHLADVESHLDRLEKLLEILIEAGLMLKVSKCRLFQREVAFLGYRVVADGLSTDPEKITAVVDWPVPCCLRNVRSFLNVLVLLEVCGGFFGDRRALARRNSQKHPVPLGPRMLGSVRGCEGEIGQFPGTRTAAEHRRIHPRHRCVRTRRRRGTASGSR